MICMQGPFSEELNTALLAPDRGFLAGDQGSRKRTAGSRKSSAAARNAGAKVVLIGRPVKEQAEGLSAGEVIRTLIQCEALSAFRGNWQIALAGIGMGNPGRHDRGSTVKACHGSGAVHRGWPDAGTDSRALWKACIFASYKPQEIREYVMTAIPEYEKVVIVAVRRYWAFTAAPKKLLEAFAGEEIRKCAAGISSVVYLCGPAAYVLGGCGTGQCQHGRYANLISARSGRYPKVFALVGKGRHGA